MEVKNLGKTSTGIQANVAGLLCYVLGVITGIIFLVTEKENKFVRFHAMQSTITFAILFVVSIVINFIPIIGVVLGALIGLVSLIVWIVLMVKAFQGQTFKLPVVGDIAEKNIG